MGLFQKLNRPYGPGSAERHRLNSDFKKIICPDIISVNQRHRLDALGFHQLIKLRNPFSDYFIQGLKL